jgi:outer membrane autotransporter protein
MTLDCFLARPRRQSSQLRAALLSATALAGSLLLTPMLTAVPALALDITGDQTVIGPDAAGDGTLGNPYVFSSSLEIGAPGLDGSVTVSAGGTVSSTGPANHVYLGHDSGETGTVIVTGTGSNWTMAGHFYVGSDGTGNLTVSDGGAITAAHFSAGGFSGVASVNLTGGSISTSSSNAYVGSGYLTLSDGGIFNISSGTGAVGIANSTGGNAQLNIGAAAGDPAAAAGTLGTAWIFFGLGTGKLVLNHTETDYELDQTFQGNGALEHYAGTTSLTGDLSGFTGATSILGGVLSINSTYGGAVTIGNGGTLGGNGTVGSIMANSGATVAPGNSIGTTNVAGNVTFAPGSTYEVEIDIDGNSDLVAATGTAWINGGTVEVIAFPDYAVGTTYTILTAGNVTGTFDAVTATGIPFLYTPTLGYTATEVTLVLEALYSTANQSALASVVDGFGAGNPVYDALSAAASPAAALDALSGDLHASANGMFLDDSRFVRDAATERLRTAFDDGTTAWGTAYGATGTRDGDGNAAGFDRHVGGILAGMDAAFGNGWRGGFVTGFGATSFSSGVPGASGSANSYHLGGYAGGMAGAYSLRGGAAYTLHQIDTTRAISIGALDETLTAGYNASTSQVFGEISRAMTLGDASFEPYAGLALVHQHSDGFSESGGDAALTAASASQALGIATLGVRGETDTREIGGRDMTFRGGLAWRHAFGDVTPETLMRFAGGSAFNIAGAPVERDSMIVEAGVDIAVSQNATLSFDFRGELGGSVRDGTLKADFSTTF